MHCRELARFAFSYPHNLPRIIASPFRATRNIQGHGRRLVLYQRNIWNRKQPRPSCDHKRIARNRHKFVEAKRRKAKKPSQTSIVLDGWREWLSVECQYRMICLGTLGNKAEGGIQILAALPNGSNNMKSTIKSRHSCTRTFPHLQINNEK